jgi:hypothetical protein
MMYGFWGEAHTGTYRSSYTDKALAESIFLNFARQQLDCWKHTRIAVNLQPDISRVGNDTVQRLMIDAGEWIRTDSIILDEPQQIELINSRPADCAVIIEDGWRRDHLTDVAYLNIPDFAHSGVDYLENAMLHALDAGANYWALWLEADNIERYFAQNPTGLDAMRQRLGYRLRPSWVWQRKRQGATELVVAITNNGVAGVPGQLSLLLYAKDGTLLSGGMLDGGQPHAGRLRLASLMLPEGFTGNEVFIRAELLAKGVAHPITWACAQGTDEKGGVPIRLLPEDAAVWRKDI